jgi:hypothetical protein
MNKEALKQTREELKEIEQLYQETLDLAKNDPVAYLEIKDELASIKKLFQNCSSKYKEKVAVFSASKDLYKDEELYEYWKPYNASYKDWLNNWRPQIDVFRKEKKAYPLDFLERILVFVNKIKGEAEVYIKQYELLKEETSPAMRPSFDKWKEETASRLNHPEQSWGIYIKDFTATKAQRISDNALSAQITVKVNLHAELEKIWREESRPNLTALLVIEENVKNTQKLYDNIQALKTLLDNAPIEFKKANDKWYQICLKDEWARHLNAITKGLIDSKERVEDSAHIKGNPELVKIKDVNLRYIDPNKKIGLYKQGKKDAHKIAANDVKQGKLNDCIVLSPIAALAGTNPSLIEKMIKEKSDGSFEVTLHVRKDSKSQERTVEKINVKREFVIDKDGNDVFAGKGDRELWVQVLEKAIADVRGGFDGINGGSSDEILQLLTGKKVKTADFKANDLELLWGDLLKAHTDKKATNFSSLVKPTNVIPLFYTTTDSQKIYYGHNYYLDKIDANKIWLNNPHGKEHLVLTKKDLETYFERYYILE